MDTTATSGTDPREAETSGGVLTFSVGDITIRVISDGHLAYPLDFIYPNVAEAELQSALAGRLDERGELPIPYRCLLVQTPADTLLIDSGLGPDLAASVPAPAGRLLESLGSAGFSPTDVDSVVLSHAHPDHIGGLVHDGKLVFPQARHVMSAVEWQCWTDEDELNRMPALLAEPARAILPMLRAADVIELTEGETEVAPGVRLAPAPGHTVGHCAVEFESGGDRALFLADAILDELHLTHPDWLSAVDMLPEETVKTRIRLLDQAVRDSSLVLAYHLAGHGHVESGHGRYRLS